MSKKRTLKIILFSTLATLLISGSAMAAIGRTRTTDEDWKASLRKKTVVVGTGETASVRIGVAGWYSTSWLKRVPITITNPGSSALTDCQVDIYIPYDTDMNSDFSDLRFTTDDMVTEISYRVEGQVDSVSITAWVEVPSLIASGDTTIYMYYGNNSAISASAGGLFWDIYNYGGAAPDPGIAGNVITVSSNRDWGGSMYSVPYNGVSFNYPEGVSNGTWEFSTKYTTFTHPGYFLDRCVRFFIAYDDAGQTIFHLSRRYDTMYIFDCPDPMNFINERNPSYKINIGSMTTGTAYNIKAEFNGTNWNIYVNGVLKRTLSNAARKNSPAKRIFISGNNTTDEDGNSDTSNQVSLLSNLFLDNPYTSPEVTVFIGEEETY